MLYFKRTLRKPLPALLFLALTLVGTLFLTVNDRAIRLNMQSIDELYDRISIPCEVLPSSRADGSLAYSPFFAADIIGLKEVADWYGTMKGPFFFEGRPEPASRTVYGTNDLSGFARDTFIDYTLDPRYADVDFDLDEPVCLMDADMAAALGHQAGDRISVVGGNADGLFDEKAPAQTLTIIGSYTCNGWSVAENSIVVPQARFYSEKEPRLIYNDWTRRRWYKYTAFRFHVKPEYNRDFDRVEELLTFKLKPVSTCYLYAGTRELKSAVRPLERRVQLQLRLEVLLRVAFVALSAVLCYLIASQERAEILIRRLYGERRSRIFTENWLCLCMLILLLMLPSVAAAALMGGKALLYTHLPLVYAAAVLAAIPCFADLCGKSMIALYQAGNRD